MLAVLLAVLVLLIVGVIHEMGHFAVCLLTGVPVFGFHLGLPRGPRLRLRLGRYPLDVSPFPFMMGVWFDREALQRLPLRKRLILYIAGPFVNFISTAVVVCAVVFSGKGLWILMRLLGIFTPEGPLPLIRWIFFFPIWFARIPNLLLSALGLFWGIAVIFALLSGAHTISNLLPIPGLDGGWVVGDILAQRGQRWTWFDAISTCFFILVLVTMVVLVFKDLLMIFLSV